MKRTRKATPEPRLAPPAPGHRHVIDWATHTVHEEPIPGFVFDPPPRAIANPLAPGPLTPAPEANASLPTPAPDPRNLVAIDEPPPPFDHAGFDPNDYEWRPVLRRPRADGWTPEVQRRFIETLADTGMVSAAAREVNMSVQSAYRLRRAAGSEGFARAWAAALDAAADTLADIAFSRAIEGVEEPVFDRDGARIGARMRYNDRMMMFLLRAYRPAQFRHAHESIRQPGEAPPPPALPMAEAVAALAPPMPADPHLLLTPDRLETLVQVAEVVADHAPPERERYARPAVEDGNPAAGESRAARFERARVREDRAEARRGFDWDDDDGYG